MGELIVITGPPGAGKSTVSADLAMLFDCSALIPGDEFFTFLRNGAISPWLAGSDKQNTAVVEAAAAAAGRLVRYCDVVYDGVVAPAFRATFLELAGVAHMHYAVLMPTLDLCVDRVQNRKGHGFTDREAAAHMWNQFHHANLEITCFFEDSDMSSSELARLIAWHVASGSIRYPPAAS
ncbi:AAA family ATPase [Mycobacterium haemophilum]